ncbi:hypothetical protein ACXZ1K_16015 [Pedobacter sp. PWIIR3]
MLSFIICFNDKRQQDKTDHPFIYFGKANTLKRFITDFHGEPAMGILPYLQLSLTELADSSIEMRGESISSFTDFIYVAIL